MICVPGGVFFLGGFLHGSPITATVPEHLVQVSTFAMDVDAMTVGSLRTLVNSPAAVTLPISKNPQERVLENACTWLGAEDGANDALPVNCVTGGVAAEICAALRKRL